MMILNRSKEKGVIPQRLQPFKNAKKREMDTVLLNQMVSNCTKAKYCLSFERFWFFKCNYMQTSACGRPPVRPYFEPSGKSVFNQLSLAPIEKKGSLSYFNFCVLLLILCF